MAKFLGFRQVSLSTFTAMTDAEKYNYMWLVRDVEAGVVKSAAIYFGTRLYAEVNSDSQEQQELENIIKSLGDSVDAEGNFVGFLPTEDHEILGYSGVTSVSAALEALEAAIIENKADIEAEVDELSETVMDVIAEVKELSAATSEALEELEKRAGEDLDELSAVTKELSAATVAGLEKAAQDLEDAKEEISEEIDEKVADAIEHVISGAPEAFDTLKEIAEWIEKHGVSAETMFNQINENTENIEELSAATEAAKAELEAEIASAVTKAEEELAEAKAELEAENEALKERVQALETKAEVDDRIHTIFGDDVEEVADENAFTQAIIADAVKYGGTVELPNDTVYDATINVE